MKDTVTGIIGAAFAAVMVVALFLIVPALGAILGAFIGWCVGFFFTGAIQATLAVFVGQPVYLAVWQLGATLGFISAFFKVRLLTPDNTEKTQAKVKEAFDDLKTQLDPDSAKS